MTTSTLQELKLGQIKTHPANIREDVGDLRELAASIVKHGVIEPLVVIPDVGAKTRQPRFLLLAGHRRLAAADLANLKTVPCMVREGVDDPAVQIETMLIENLQRTDLTPMEEARAYQQLLEFPDYTQKMITERTGRPATTVRGRIALTKLSEQTQGLIQSRDITLADAMVLAEFADDPALERLERAVGTNDWPYQVERARSTRARVKARAKVEVAFKKAGVQTTTNEQLTGLEEAEMKRADETETEFDPPWIALSDYRIHPNDHVDCPGHAVDIENFDDWDDHATPDDYAFVCLQPALHAGQSDQGPVPLGTGGASAPRDSVSGELVDPEAAAAEAKRKADAEADRRAAQQLAEDLATAATVRRAHLAHVLAEGDLRLATHSLIQLVTELVLRWFNDENRPGPYFVAGRRYVAAVLLPARDPATVDQEQILAAVTKLDLARLSIAATLIEAATNDKDLLDPNGWPAGHDQWSARRCASWRERLGGELAYEWSDVELRMLETATDS